MPQKIITIGNSLGVVIPKKLVEETGIKPGVKVYVEKDPHGSSIVIAKESRVFKSSITPDFLRIVNNINKKYGPALQKLAKINHD